MTKISFKSNAKEKLDYSKKNYWYNNGQDKYDENKIDVFYCLSTTLIKAVDEEGNETLNSTISDEDKKIMNREFEYISTKMFDEEHFNFFAPYYRQMTFASYDAKNISDLLSGIEIAKSDIKNAFDYYMQYQNNGRPFIVAGFSQGAIMTGVLLMHMTDEQFSRLIASYMIGFQVTEEDLKNKHIIPATSADDLGVVISYNSVESVDHIWKDIEGKAAVCINPLNWRTDDVKAKLKYDGDEATVYVDQNHHLLVVEGLDSNKYDGMGYPIEKGVYHMWDIKFYADAINKNAIHRAKLFNK